MTRYSPNGIGPAP